MPLEIILYLISFIISSIPCLFLTAPPVEDALGTISAAAYLSGADFREFVALDGYFYKYGQTIWYLPCFLCLKEPAVRYKAMLVVNSMLTSLIPVIACRIGRKYLGLEKRMAAGMALTAGLMPSVLLYGKYTWAEPVLFIVPWVVILILLGLENRRGWLLSAALAWISVYAFMCHQRGIVIVLAVLMVTMIFRIVTGRWIAVMPVYFINLAAALVLDRFLDKWQKQVVYLGIPPKHNTLAAFLKPEIYHKIFSLQGQKVIGATILGWMYNCGVSGLGITLLGIGVMLVICLGAFNWRGHEKDSYVSGSGARAIISTFGFISFVGAFLLGILFFFETMYGYWDGSMIERCDHLVFGRYIESSYPLLFYMGLYGLWGFSTSSGDIKRKGAFSSEKEMGAAVIGLMIVLTLFFALVIAPSMDGVDSYVHSLMSMNFSFDMSGVTVTRDVIANLPAALILSGVISTFVFGLIFIIGSRRSVISRRYVFLLCIAVFLYIYIRSFCDIIYRVDHLGLTEYAKVYLGG
jgi:hypothetical protein